MRKRIKLDLSMLPLILIIIYLIFGAVNDYATACLLNKATGDYYNHRYSAALTYFHVLSWLHHDDGLYTYYVGAAYLHLGKVRLAKIELDKAVHQSDPVAQDWARKKLAASAFKTADAIHS